MRAAKLFIIPAAILIIFTASAHAAHFKFIKNSNARGMNIVARTKLIYDNSVLDVRDCRFYINEKEEWFLGKGRPVALYKRKVHFWLHNRLYRSRVRLVSTTSPREKAYGISSRFQSLMMSRPCLFDPDVMWRQKNVRAIGITKIGTHECNVITFADRGVRYYAAITVREPKVLVFIKEGRVLANRGKGYEKINLSWQYSPKILVSWSRFKRPVPVLKSEIKEIYDSKGRLLERITYSYSDYIIDKGIPQKLLK